MTIVVGYSPHKRDRASIHLGATLARSGGQDLRIVTVVPAPWPTPVAGGTDREFAQWAREYGDSAVAEAGAAVAEICPDLAIEPVAVPGSSVARGLIAEAEKVDAVMIVVGSGSDGSWGAVVVSSTADRLLHSSPVPVAVATRGYRAPQDATVTRATCAFRGDDASRAVLARAASICRDVGARLRVATFGVRGRTMYPPPVLGEDDILQTYVKHTAAEQDRAVAALGEAVPDSVETTVATGKTWPEALEALDWDKGDVLVVGSSSASFAARLFLGSNAAKIVRHSPVPVIVVP
jgi:nucleotide-binding universal stress UspA family protein